MKVFAFALTFICGLGTGVGIMDVAAERREQQRAELRRVVPVIPARSILDNESCVETVRACYARKRMERVKGQG